MPNPTRRVNDLSPAENFLKFRERPGSQNGGRFHFHERFQSNPQTLSPFGMADYVAVLGWPRLDRPSLQSLKKPSLRPTDAGVRDPDSLKEGGKPLIWCVTWLAFITLFSSSFYFFPSFWQPCSLTSKKRSRLTRTDLNKSCVDHVTFTLTLPSHWRLLVNCCTLKHGTMVIGIIGNVQAFPKKKTLHQANVPPPGTHRNTLDTTNN